MVLLGTFCSPPVFFFPSFLLFPCRLADRGGNEINPNSGIITSIIRWTAFFTDQFVFGDQSWADNPLTIYLACEPTVYLICACLLSCRPLLHRLGETKAASTIYRWLRSMRSQTSRSDNTMGEHGKTPSRKRSMNDRPSTGQDCSPKGSVGDTVVQHYVAPFHGNATCNSSSKAERGEAVELRGFAESPIHVRTEYTVQRT